MNFILLLLNLTLSINPLDSTLPYSSISFSSTNSFEDIDDAVVDPEDTSDQEVPSESEYNIDPEYFPENTEDDLSVFENLVEIDDFVNDEIELIQSNALVYESVAAPVYYSSFDEDIAAYSSGHYESHYDVTNTILSNAEVDGLVMTVTLVGQGPGGYRYGVEFKNNNSEIYEIRFYPIICGLISSSSDFCLITKVDDCFVINKIEPGASASFLFYCADLSSIYNSVVDIYSYWESWVDDPDPDDPEPDDPDPEVTAEQIDYSKYFEILIVSLGFVGGSLTAFGLFRYMRSK